MRHARTRRATSIAGAVMAMAMTAQAAPAATITVAPNAPVAPSNCYPFGVGLHPGNPWVPYAAWFYMNVPAFELASGDTLAFDLGAENDVDIELDLALARTTTNGGTVEGESFQTVVTNTQTPLNPRGDTTVGNFELQFIAQAPFSFAGGGLIIRFSNPSAAYGADDFCDPVLGGASPSDPSGFFVQRAFNDADGLSPWDNPDPGDIGGFRVTNVDPPVDPPAVPDTDPPETTITKGAPSKTDKTKVRFRFTSDEPGSAFECKIDKQPYKACSTPKRVKRLDEGKHKFKVRAIDAAGNLDPSADKDKFKVVG
jgi:hypothetical protein